MIILMIYCTIASNGEKTGLLFLFIFCALPINSKNWSHCFINGESGERFLEGEKNGVCVCDRVKAGVWGGGRQDMREKYG